MFIKTDDESLSIYNKINDNRDNLSYELDCFMNTCKEGPHELFDFIFSVLDNTVQECFKTILDHEF